METRFFTINKTIINVADVNYIHYDEVHDQLKVAMRNDEVLVFVGNSNTNSEDTPKRTFFKLRDLLSKTNIFYT